jgi:hypothetical protein
MEALSGVATKLTNVLVLLATPLASLWLAWGTFKALLSGGAERALSTLIVRALIMGVLLGVLTHIPETFAIVQAIGGFLLQTVLDAFRTSAEV